MSLPDDPAQRREVLKRKWHQRESDVFQVRVFTMPVRLGQGCLRDCRARWQVSVGLYNVDLALRPVVAVDVAAAHEGAKTAV